MSNHSASTASTSSGVLTAYRWLTTVFAVLIIVQAFLGTRGFFSDPDLVNLHEMLANAMFLLVVVQTVLSWVLYSRSVVGVWVVVLNVALVLLTISQTGLGYITRNADNFSTAISLHIPNGVLLMGVSTVIAAMAWRTLPSERTGQVAT